MLYWLLVTIYVVVCLLLLLAVLLQQGKGGDIAAAFGGGGGQAAFGARQGATVLSKASAILGGCSCWARSAWPSSARAARVR